MTHQSLEPGLFWLSSRQWDRILPIVRRNPRHGGIAGCDTRRFVEAVLYHIRTGTPWRDLPPAFGAWNSIYVRFKRWFANQVWHRLFQALSDDAAFRAVHLSEAVVELHRKLLGVGTLLPSRILLLLQSQLAAVEARGAGTRWHAA